jgi:hypothetical protein
VARMVLHPPVSTLSMAELKMNFRMVCLRDLRYRQPQPVLPRCPKNQPLVVCNKQQGANPSARTGTDESSQFQPKSDDRT